jgi:glucan biosynthesis protein C
VLHQPVVVALAHGVVGWSAPVVVEYVVIVAGSFALILALYEFVVRRTRVTRFLFGMRTAPQPAAPDRG